MGLWLMTQAVSPRNRRAWNLLNDPSVDWGRRVSRLRDCLGGDWRVDTAMSPEAFADCLRTAGLEVGLPGTQILGRHFRYFMLRKSAAIPAPPTAPEPGGRGMGPSGFRVAQRR